MPRLLRPALLRILVVLAAAGLAVQPSRGASDRAEIPALTWAVDNRNPTFSADWRQRLVLRRGGEIVLGGRVSPGTPGGQLYRRRPGGWEAWKIGPPQADRTFVFAEDPTGSLWVCPYATSESPYDGLHIRRYDGRHWSEQEVTPGIWPQAMAMVSGREGWIAGNNGRFLHDLDGRWRLETLDVAERDRQGLNLLSLHMLGPEEGWAVGAQGLVAHYQRGRWRVVPASQELRSEKLNDVDVTADGRVWVVGTRGLIGRYDGARWQLWKLPVAFFMGIDMLSPTDGWAVGAYGAIFRYDGAKWRPQPSPTPANLNHVAMSSPREGWIAGEGVILHATVAGRLPLRDVTGLGPSFAVGQPARSAAAVDVDGDGDLDLFTLRSTSLSWYENRGTRGFVASVSIPAPPAVDAGVPSLQGAAWGDVEGDGDLDLLVLGERPPATWLYRNLGGGRFAAPERLGSEPLGGGGDSAYFLDLSGDGQQDLYLARSALPGPKRLDNPLYLNDGAGGYSRPNAATRARGIENLALWGDLDGDLDLDAVLPGNGNELQLLRNDGGRLHDATAGSGLDAPLGGGQMFQGSLLDLDLDGDLDLILLGDRLYVFRNDGRGRFRRDLRLFDPVANNPAFNSRMSNAGDLDHDGYPEVLLQAVTGGRPALRLFSRGADGRYHDVAPLAGLAGLTGSAAVFADWDGDGDLDLFLAGEQGSRLLENRQDDRSYLEIRLHGEVSNRLAVGAWVRIWSAGHLGERGFLRGDRQLGVGFNPTGVQDLSELCFGLDRRRRYDVEVVFPSGRRAIERSVTPGRRLEIHELPVGIRALWLGLRWGRRAWIAADLEREGVKLVLIVLSLALWRRLSRRLGARLLAPRWSVALVLLAAYLLTAGRFAPSREPAPHLYQLLGFTGVLGLLAASDRQLSRFHSSRFLGPYRLGEPLGEGGMGIVYRARHVVTGRTVALKVLHPRRLEREEHRIRFLREARILTRLAHPNIVRVSETGEIAGHGYISMELLAGQSLRELLARHGPLAPAAVTAILEAVCGALAAVHALGIVHRDVKSDNLFVLAPDEALRDGGWQNRIKLMDFGLARVTGMETLTARRALLGTLAYMPPERLRGRDLEPRSDLYSLGVVAYEALTGRLPFEAVDEASLLALIQKGEIPSLRQRRPEISAALEKLVHQMLAQDPAERPASAQELAARFSALLLDREESCAERELAAPPSGSSEEREIATEAIWASRFDEARRLAADRTTEAQVLLLACLGEIEEALRSLDRDQQALYCRRHGVAQVLALANWLNP
jgi:serine/threonine protein kinase